MKNNKLEKYIKYEKCLLKYKTLDNTMYEIIKKYYDQKIVNSNTNELAINELALITKTTIENIIKYHFTRGERVNGIIENIKLDYNIDVKDHIVNGVLMEQYITALSDTDICLLLMGGQDINIKNLYEKAKINQEQIKMLINDEKIGHVIILIMVLTEETTLKTLINETIIEMAYITKGYPNDSSDKKLLKIEMASLMIDLVKSYLKFGEKLNMINVDASAVANTTPDAYIMNNILDFIKNETTLVVKEIRDGYMDYMCNLVRDYGDVNNKVVAEVLRITSEYKSKDNSLAKFKEYEENMGLYVYKMTINNGMIYPYMINYMEKNDEYKINEFIYIGPIILNTINNHLTKNEIINKIDDQMTFRPSNNLIMNWLVMCPDGHRLYIIGHKIDSVNEYIYTFGYRGTNDNHEIMEIPNSNICVMGDRCYYKKNDDIVMIGLKQPIQVGSEILKKYMICDEFMDINEKESEMYIMIGHGITHPTNLTTIPIKTANKSNKTMFVMPDNVYLIQLTHTASTLYLNDPIAILVSHVYNYRDGMVKYIKKWIEKRKNGVEIKIDDIFNDKDQENIMKLFEIYCKKEDTKIQNILNSGDKTKKKLEKILNEHCSFSEVYCPGNKVLNKNINLNYEYNSVYSGDYLYYFKTGIFKVSQENNENMYESEASNNMLNIFTRVKKNEIKDNSEKLIGHFIDIFKGGESLVNIPKITEITNNQTVNSEVTNNQTVNSEVTNNQTVNSEVIEIEEEEKIINKEENKYPKGKIYDNENIKNGIINLNKKPLILNGTQKVSYGEVKISTSDTVKRLHNKEKKIILLDFSCGSYVDTEDCNSILYAK